MSDDELNDDGANDGNDGVNDGNDGANDGDVANDGDAANDSIANDEPAAKRQCRQCLDVLPPNPVTKGYIYVFRAGTTNHYKVGFTRIDAEARRRNLNTGNPETLVLCGKYAVHHGLLSQCEKLVHSELMVKSGPDTFHRCTDRQSKEWFVANGPEQLLLAAVSDATCVYNTTAQVADCAKQISPTDVGTTLVDLATDPTLMSRVTQLRLLMAQRDVLSRQIDHLTDQLKISLDRAPGACLNDQPVVVFKSTTRQIFDSKRFTKEHPDMWKSYRVTSTSRPLRIL